MVKAKIDRTIEEGLRYKGSARLQLLLLIISGLVLTFLLSGPLGEFHANDKYPGIVALTPQKIINFGGSPTFVTAGMYIRDFPKFDVVDGHFIADITVWFRFDPRLVSLNRIGKFTFERARVIHKAKPNTRIEGTKLVAQYNMRVDFNIQLDYTNFPLDDHRLNFTLTHYFLSPSDIIFKSSRSNLIVSPEIRTSGWKYIDGSVKTGYLEDKIDPQDPRSDVYHPRIVFSLDYARIGVRHILSIIIPLLLIFFLSLFTFSINPFGEKSSNIISISVAAVTATIAHRFVIERMSPAAGYFMLSDHLFLFLLLACCTVFVVNMFGGKILRSYKNGITIALHVWIVSIFLYFLFPLF